MSAPTRLELMAFADGEVDEGRGVEIERWLATHEDDKAFVEAILGLSEVVGEAGVELSAPAPRSSALVRSTAPWEVAGCVMAAIDAESDEIAQSEAPVRSGPRLVSSAGAAHPGEPRRDPTAPQALRPKPARPANRLREVIALGALFAAAAGIMLWMSGGPTAGSLTSLPAAPASETVVSSLSASSEDESEEDATAVDEVDFGDQQGAIFFVKGPKASRTAVVWIDEQEPTP